MSEPQLYSSLDHPLMRCVVEMSSVSVCVCVTSENVTWFGAELDLFLIKASMGAHGPWSREQSFSKGGSPLQSGEAGGEPKTC